MNKHPIQVICKVLDIDTRSYSGRGMYGKECLAITSGLTVSHLFADIIDAVMDDEFNSNPTILEECDSTLQDVVKDVTKAFRRLSQDSMGTGNVYYFQGIDLVEEDEEGSSED